MLSIKRAEVSEIFVSDAKIIIAVDCFDAQQEGKYAAYQEKISTKMQNQPLKCTDIHI